MTTAFGPDFDAPALAKLAPELSDVFTAAGFTTDGVAGYLGRRLLKPYSAASRHLFR